MTSIYIESEGDMEYGISHCKNLARLEGTKHLTLAFPSAKMYRIFIHNLHDDLLEDKTIPDFVDIECDIVLPPWEFHDE